jgi:LemA protein
LGLTQGTYSGEGLGAGLLRRLRAPARSAGMTAGGTPATREERDMDMFVWVVLAIVVVLVGFVIAVYNGLVTRRNRVQEAASDIDVQLKRRYELIPNLVNTVKGYATHERELLEKVTAARAGLMTGTTGERIAASNQLTETLKSLFAVAEAYPDLKTNETFQQLQIRISSLENAIADRREFYNESVNVNNVRIEQFPDSIVAGMFSFKAAQLLEFQTDEKADVDVKKLFGA